MPGAASIFNSISHRRATVPEVNALIHELIRALDNAHHEWFVRDRDELVARLPRRRGVTQGALDEWARASGILRRLPYYLRRWPADEESVLLLFELAAHPSAVVSVPAAVSLMVLSRVPPLPALEAVAALRESGALHHYAQGVGTPAWWQRPSVAYRSRRWERLCVLLAEHLHGPENVLAALRNETLCSEGALPDIVLQPVERDESGRIMHAPTIIDAKSGQLPHTHTYLNFCDRLEYWHAGFNGEWVGRNGDGRCAISYRDRTQLEELAPPEIARDMAELDSYFGLYLRFLRKRALTPVGPHDLANSGILEDGQ